MIRSFAACGTLGVVFTFVLQNTAAESKSCGGPCGRNGRLSGIRDPRYASPRIEHRWKRFQSSLSGNLVNRCRSASGTRAGDGREDGLRERHSAMGVMMFASLVATAGSNSAGAASPDAPKLMTENSLIPAADAGTPALRAGEAPGRPGAISLRPHIALRPWSNLSGRDSIRSAAWRRLDDGVDR